MLFLYLHFLLTDRKECKVISCIHSAESHLHTFVFWSVFRVLFFFIEHFDLSIHPPNRSKDYSQFYSCTKIVIGTPNFFLRNRYLYNTIFRLLLTPRLLFSLRHLIIWQMNQLFLLLNHIFPCFTFLQNEKEYSRNHQDALFSFFCYF